MYELRKEWFSKAFKYPPEVIALCRKRAPLEFLLTEIDSEMEFFALHPNKGAMYTKKGEEFSSAHLIYYIEKTSIIILD